MRAEVVVIGGGVIGCSCAYRLARRGMRVVLVERGDIASGASGACDGFLSVQSKRPGRVLRMALESLAMFERIEEELGEEVEYRRCGGMIAAEAEEGLETLRSIAEGMSKVGVPVELLGPEEAVRLEPYLSPEMAGATHSPIEGQVNPMKLAYALARAARRSGAELMTHTTALRVEVEGERVRSVLTDKGRIWTGAVVIAAGAWSGEIAGTAGVELGIIPRRGQVLVTQPMPPMVGRVILCACYLKAKRGGGVGVATSIEQTASGTILIGGTREFAGFDTRTTPEGILGIIEHASRLMPILREIPVIRSFAGLRPYSPSGEPLIGPMGPDGLFVATGHEGDGVTLSLITGELIAKAVAGEAGGVL
ncbi:FAD-binding oxidoreductase [Candidatus Poribacteria bacterium]|nr:MAG: FAD-binding oxidoreductase [Candidatus Poribacteria bacterium]